MVWARTIVGRVDAKRSRDIAVSPYAGLGEAAAGGTDDNK
jgi:hypothetical protein